MSHRWDCPDKRDAEREGERAAEYGRSRSSNPYESVWRDEGCPEAAEAWRDGYRHQEMREEERREEEAAQRRADVRRAYELEEEAAYYESMREADERAYDEAQRQAAYDEDQAAARAQEEAEARPSDSDGAS
jgi:hypothetical protein